MFALMSSLVCTVKHVEVLGGSVFPTRLARGSCAMIRVSRSGSGGAVCSFSANASAPNTRDTAASKSTIRAKAPFRFPTSAGL